MDISGYARDAGNNNAVWARKQQVWRVLYRTYITLFNPDLWEAVKILSENGLQACVYSPTVYANNAEVWQAMEIARAAGLIICTNNGALVGNLKPPIYAEPVKMKPQLRLVISNDECCASNALAKRGGNEYRE